MTLLSDACSKQSNGIAIDHWASLFAAQQLKVIVQQLFIKGIVLALSSWLTYYLC
jgi:hypothetical protein